MRTQEQQRAVDGCVNYLGTMDRRPEFFSDGQHRNNLVLEPHEVAITDRRGATAASLSEEGFELVAHHTAMTNFRDADAASRVYLPEIRELMTGLTGAPKIVLTQPVLRWSERESHFEHVNSRPARFVHVDYSRHPFHDFARKHIAGDAEQERWLRGRYAAFNIWRVLTPPPQDCPLAVLDRRTTRRCDVVEGDAVIDGRGKPEFRFGSFTLPLRCTPSLELLLEHGSGRGTGVHRLMTVPTTRCRVARTSRLTIPPARLAPCRARPANPRLCLLGIVTRTGRSHGEQENRLDRQNLSGAYRKSSARMQAGRCHPGRSLPVSTASKPLNDTNTLSELEARLRPASQPPHAEVQHRRTPAGLPLPKAVARRQGCERQVSPQMPIARLCAAADQWNRNQTAAGGGFILNQVGAPG